MRKFVLTLSLLAFLFSSIPVVEARGRAQKRQNAAADRHDLDRIRDIPHLKRLIAGGYLVKIDGSDTDAYAIADELGEEDPGNRALYMHGRPYTKAFLKDLLGRAHREFGREYKVTSLTRTWEYQRLLCKSNDNAICGGKGWKRSSHLTGATVDISYVGFSKSEHRWFRRELDALQKRGTIIYIKEYAQSCYHIMVLPTYGKGSKAKATKKAKPTKKAKAKKPQKKKKKRGKKRKRSR
ncbi:MAG: DUF5715 family protein [Patescibacteria group bacterium]|nr:MAG: DUF5715 family protein [Patescibacteria group bacterium]